MWLLTALNEYPNDRQRAVLTLMNEVHLHSKRLASYGMFARCVEMELQQFIPRTIHLNPVSFRERHFNRMTIVVDIQGCWLVVEGDSRKRCRRGIHKVDRRLVRPHSAKGIFWTELSPNGGSVLGAVAPLDLIGMG